MQPTSGELSGPQWCVRFPTSTSVEDLEPSFRPKAKAFLAALSVAGASVIITATLRPPERAYLMHYAWQIARSLISANEVPSYPGVLITWVHATEDATVAAAAQMVTEYRMVAEASRTSNHLTGKAIDLIIGWTGTLTIKDAVSSIAIVTDEPRDGTNASVATVGASFLVFHQLPYDPPHWSYDGH